MHIKGKLTIYLSIEIMRFLVQVRDADDADNNILRQLAAPRIALNSNL